MLLRRLSLTAAAILLATACAPSGHEPSQPYPELAGPLDYADLVLVKKNERRLYLLKNGKPLRSYKVALGREPVGRKQIAGDGRTPEGNYIIDRRNPNSRYYKALHISYPEVPDRIRAAQLGASPGGDILIHGQPSDPRKAKPYLQSIDWTEGCIAVHNREMDEIWLAVRDGTPIRIEP